jgi:hypothetical protein
VTREPIYAALFGLVSPIAGLITTSRKLKHWSDVPASQRPALFQAQVSETTGQFTGRPTVWTLNLKLYVYVSTKGAASPGEVINPILDAITAKFNGALPGSPQTLGGMVHWARISGSIETSEGTLGDDEVAIIPVSILTL